MAENRGWDGAARDQQTWPVPEGSYIGRHWNGDLSLPVSFWVNGVVVNLVFGIIAYIIVYSVARSGAIGATIALIWIILALSIPLSVWQLTGTWRSAEKHKHFTGRKGWATVAQVLVALGWIGLVYNVFDTIRAVSSIN